MKKYLLSCLILVCLANSLFAAEGILKPNDTTLRIASYNIMQNRLLPGRTREHAWKRIMPAVNADIWALQEMFYGEGWVEADGQGFVDHVRNFTGQNDWNYSWDREGRYLLTRYDILWNGTIGARRVHGTWIDLPPSVSSKDVIVINVHLKTDITGQATHARDFIREVRAGTKQVMINDVSVTIPQDISIVMLGDFNAGPTSTAHNLITAEGLIDVDPKHNGTASERNTIGSVVFSGGNPTSMGGNEIDYIIYGSDVLTDINNFIFNPLIMEQSLLDQYGINRTDIAIEPEKSFDLVNGSVNCDHFMLVSDFTESMSSSPNNSAYVSLDVPNEMDPGETAEVSITMRNIGSDSWSTANGHSLGTQDPANNTIWTGSSRLSLSTTVAPGAEHTWTFNITAPDSPGMYDFKWRMIDEAGANQGWFGDWTPLMRIAVGPQPIRREAENFDVNSGFNTQTTTDEGSGYNLSHSAAGDFVEYNFNIPESGTYAARFRYAAATTNASFQLKNGDNILATISESPTGGYQTWATSAGYEFDLAFGNVTLTIFATGGGWNLNWFEIVLTDPNGGPVISNYVANASFEEGSAGPNLWSLGNAAEWSTENAHEGTYSIKVTNNSSPTQQTVPIETDTDYEISVWILASGVTAGNLVFDTQDKFDSPTQTPGGTAQFLGNAGSAPVWTKFEGAFNSGNLSSFNLRIFGTGSMLGTAYVDNIVLKKVTVTLDPYEQWKTDNGVSDDLADTDEDGLINLVEFAVGGDPNSAVSGQKPVLIDNLSTIDFRFRRNQSTITYTVERSSDLINWTDHIVVDDSHGIVGADAVVPVPLSAMSNGKLFLRLKVEN